MTKNSIFFAFLFSIGVFSFTSCLSLDSTQASEAQFDKVPATSAVSDQVTNLAEGFVTDFISQTSLQQSTMQKVTSDITKLPVITMTNKDGYAFKTFTVKTYTLYFGDTKNFYTGSDGKKYRGTIIVERYGYQSPDTIRTSKGLDFYSNDDNIKFDRTVSGAGGVLTIISNESIVYANGKTSFNKSTQVRKGESYGFSFTGGSNGQSSNGQLYSSSITKPLVSLRGWKYFVEGTIAKTLNGANEILDFGTGAKDSLYTVTINGVAKEKYLNWNNSNNINKNDTIVIAAQNGIVK